MIYRTLGTTGLKVSAIALGCEGFVGKEATTVRAEFDHALALGINFLDIYTSNPEVRSNLGEALAGRREKFLLQGHLCSVWEKGQYLRTRDPKKARAAFEDLLQRLGTDYIDVGMIHYVDDEKDFHRVFDGEIIRMARQLKAEGRIRHIGMSSHNPVVARMAAESGDIEVLMFSVNPCYDLLPPSEDVEQLWADQSYENPLHNIDPDRERLYNVCESRGVGIDVMKVYAGGDILSDTDSPFGAALTPVQCIDYALTRPAVAAVMVGCRSTAEMDAAAAWCTSTPEARDYASVMARMDKFTWRGHCMYCGHCAPCTVGIDIAAVNKYYNLTVAQGFIPETVGDHYRLLSHHASECIACGRCEKNCPFGVEIIEQLKKAAETFGY